LVAKLIEEAKAEIPDLHLEEVDITEHPEVAVKYRVMATPAIAINGRLAFTGVPREADLRRAFLEK
jgi:hypothetical protein